MDMPTHNLIATCGAATENALKVATATWSSRFRLMHIFASWLVQAGRGPLLPATASGSIEALGKQSGEKYRPGVGTNGKIEGQLRAASSSAARKRQRVNG